MIAVIPTQGLGLRMRPLTNHMPKALVPILGVPILQRLLMSLSETGINTVIITTNPTDTSIRQFLLGKEFPFCIELIKIKPVSALVDLLVISNHVKSDFFSFDCDLITQPNELCSFVRTAPRLLADLVVGTTRYPPLSTERAVGIAKKGDQKVSILDRGISSGQLRLVPSFFWTPKALEGCDEYISQGIISGPVYMKEISKSRIVRSVYYEVALDVNTPDEVSRAEVLLRSL